MQSRNRVLTDFAKVADGALSAFSGVKGEMEGVLRAQIERILIDMDLVPRDEFEAVKAMAAKARQENEALAKRVADMEALMEKCGAIPAEPKAATKKPAPRKTASRRKAAPKKTA